MGNIRFPPWFTAHIKLEVQPTGHLFSVTPSQEVVKTAPWALPHQKQSPSLWKAAEVKEGLGLSGSICHKNIKEGLNFSHKYISVDAILTVILCKASTLILTLWYQDIFYDFNK